MPDIDRTHKIHCIHLNFGNRYHISLIEWNSQEEINFLNN